MTVLDLINIINTHNAKIVFDDLQDCADRVRRGEHLIYFTPVEGKERQKYEKTKSPKMTSTTPTIHMPNISIRELVNVYECDGTGVFDVTKEMIKPFLYEDISFDVAYTTFLFLHEVGHWMQFEKVDRNISLYVNADIDLERENFDKVSELKKQRDKRIKKGSTCVLTAKEKKLLRQYMLEYRNIPKEKDADQLAIDNMKAALELISKISKKS